MKKFLVVTVVLAVACLSSVAFAVDTTISGEVNFRQRLFENFDLNRSTNGETTSRTIMETRYLVSVNVKADNNVKGKLTLWNDYDVMGINSRGRTDSASTKGTSGATSTVLIREAWVDFMVPDTNLGLQGGKYLTQLGNAWFMRSNYGGITGYKAYYKTGNTIIAAQDAKFAENGTDGLAQNSYANDVDLYTVMGTTKLGGMTLGVDLSMLRDNIGTILASGGTKGRLYNLGLHLNGKLGSATLKAEVDAQSGMVDMGSGTATRYSGKQIVVQGSIPMDAITVNATAAYGSGNKSGDTPKAGIMTLQDIARHYTFIYEYRMKGADGGVNNGFANTTALSLGASAKVSKNVEVGADVWYLRASEQVALNSNPAKSYDLGTEIDGAVKWKITKDLSWNWDLAYFLPGAAYNTATIKADPAWGVQGILSLKF